jgi:hypothetical protein
MSCGAALSAELFVLRLEIEVMHAAGKVLWSFEFAVNERFVDDYLRRDAVSSLRCHASTRFRIVSKLRCIRSTPTEMQSIRENDFECLATTGVKSWRCNRFW